MSLNSTPRSKWSRVILAHNLRHYRLQMEVSQQKIASLSGISHRLYQNLEAGKGNPTLESVEILANTFKVTVPSLLRPTHLRIEKTPEEFIATLKKNFQSSPLAIAVRNLEGVVLWGSPAAEKLAGVSLSKAPIDLLNYFPVETREIFQQQLECERRGTVRPYIVIANNPHTKTRNYIRAYPTVILSPKGKSALFTVVYISDLSKDSELTYSEFINYFFEAVWGS